MYIFKEDLKTQWEFLPESIWKTRLTNQSLKPVVISAPKDKRRPELGGVLRIFFSRKSLTEPIFGDTIHLVMVLRHL